MMRDYTPIHRYLPHLTPRTHRMYLTAPRPILDAPAILPVSDLRPNLMPVRDQGPEGSCSSFSTRALREYAYFQATGKLPPQWFSTAFNYYWARFLEGTLPQDSGATGGDELQGDVTYGTCLESDFPYTADPAAVPSAQAIANALAYRIPQAAPTPVSVDGTQGLLSELSELNAVSIGIAVYQSFEQGVGSDGVIPMPNTTSEQLLGYHEILVCGHDLSKGLITFRNSWGAGWGVAGYGFLPFSFFNNPSLYIEAETIVAVA